MRGKTKMIFGLFKRIDPICGMKEEKGKGRHKGGRWFCSDKCSREYSEKKNNCKKEKKGCCCGH